MPVTVPSILLEEVKHAASMARSIEICGLLFGAPDRIDAVRPTANVAADPAATFEIDPAALFAAHRAERAGGPRLIGCYHSHPNGSPTPSARDAAAAEPGKLWLIIGGGEARLWRAYAGRFEAVALIVG